MVGAGRTVSQRSKAVHGMRACREVLRLRAMSSHASHTGFSDRSVRPGILSAIPDVLSREPTLGRGNMGAPPALGTDAARPPQPHHSRASESSGPEWPQ